MEYPTAVGSPPVALVLPLSCPSSSSSSPPRLSSVRRWRLNCRNSWEMRHQSFGRKRGCLRRVLSVVALILSAGSHLPPQAAACSGIPQPSPLNGLVWKEVRSREMLGGGVPILRGEQGDGGGGEAVVFDKAEIEEVAEAMRRRIPSDEEIVEGEDGARQCVGLEANIKAVEQLRRELASFAIDVEGAECVATQRGASTGAGAGGGGDVRAEDDEEDVYGAALFLQGFWREEGTSMLGTAQLQAPVLTGGGARAFADAVRLANADLLRDAEGLPAACGANMVHALPHVSPVPPVVSDAIVASSRELLASEAYRGRLVRLLELCVDQRLGAGYARVACALQCCLPVSTTARVMGVLQREARYFAYYWGPGEDLAEARAGVDCCAVLGVLREREPQVHKALVDAPARLKDLVVDWMSGEAVFRALPLGEAMHALGLVLRHGSEELVRLAASFAVLAGADWWGQSATAGGEKRVGTGWDRLDHALDEVAATVRGEVAFLRGQDAAHDGKWST